MKRLKDKVWNVCHIKIDRLVRQDVDGISTTNTTVMYLVEIKRRGGLVTMFNAKSPRELWKKLKEESYVI
jgi:hypothetical protein